MLSILHGSDIHFGKPHDPAAAEAFLRLAHERDDDLLVISGDLTQRAKAQEFEQARAFLDALPDGVPRVVTPGNHDVPLYRVFERLFEPYRHYRRIIAEELDTCVDVSGARVVALNSAAPRRAIINGHLSRRQLDFARSSFAEAPSDAVRILVVHHNLVAPGGREADDVLPGSDQVVETLQEMGVDLVLSGHLHRAFVATSLDALRPGFPGRGAVIVHSGTTSSTRGRGREKRRNTCNGIRVSSESVEVVHWMLEASEGRFRAASIHAFPRRPGVWGGRVPHALELR